ncbi:MULTISPECIES: hypothetical protein [unclassified Nonomuraea]|uniref:hypothetical protein n=1 Tax=unclassified Nonomuraea TaxID=2593643 RepID=UPI0033CDEA3E
MAVPYGRCQEPANVRAGGNACAIRFQCAACTFFRADPTYLPEMEQHVMQLRADRERAIAMDVDE